VRINGVLIAYYRPNPGEVRDQKQLMRAKDGTVVEVFERASPLES
jgi:hypothetical protein